MLHVVLTTQKLQLERRRHCSKNGMLEIYIKVVQLYRRNMCLFLINQVNQFDTIESAIYNICNLSLFPFLPQLCLISKYINESKFLFTLYIFFFKFSSSIFANIESAINASLYFFDARYFYAKYQLKEIVNEHYKIKHDV